MVDGRHLENIQFERKPIVRYVIFCVLKQPSWIPLQFGRFAIDWTVPKWRRDAIFVLTT